MRLRDVLARFRPAGAAGRARHGGVPADRSAELTAELQPSLTLLEQAEAEAREVREEAAREATRRREKARRQAEETVASARARAGDARVERAEEVRRTAESEAAGLLAAADREVLRIRRLARARMPALAARVAQSVTDDLRAGRYPAALDEPASAEPSRRLPEERSGRDRSAGNHGVGDHGIDDHGRPTRQPAPGARPNGPTGGRQPGEPPVGQWKDDSSGERGPGEQGKDSPRWAPGG